MDAEARSRHLQDMLADVRSVLDHLRKHQAKVLTHHDSRERAKALTQAKSSIRRHEKLERRIERAIRVR